MADVVGTLASNPITATGGARPMTAGRKRAHNWDAVLDRWAKGDAARQIAAELAIEKQKTIGSIVLSARRAGDPRAVERNPRVAKRAPASAPTPRQRFYSLLPGSRFVAGTVFATTLGTGSVACQRVPVSVSEIPAREINLGQ